MGSEFAATPLSELIELTLSSVDKKSKPNEEPVRLCNYMDVYSNRAIHPRMTFMKATATANEINRCKLRHDDVLITKDSEKSDDIAIPAWVREPEEDLVCGYHLAILRPVEERIDGQFLSYALQHYQVAHQFHSYANGVTRFGLRKDDILRVLVPSPPLPEQKAIAHILGTLDDKIELNRRMNATLEGMAQALFKSWFVDFDPVIDNALAAGNPIPEELAPRAEVRKNALANGTTQQGSLDHPTLSDPKSLFPSAFEFDDELGWIPEGWVAKQMGQMLRSVSDTYPLKTVDEIIFLNTGDILDGKFLHADYSATAGLPGQAKKSIQKHDILYSEIRPRNRRFAYVHFDGAQHVVSTKLMVLRATSEISSLFAYLILKQDSTIDHLQMLAESRSGTFPQITFDVLAGIQVALPPNLDLIELFTSKVLQPTQNKQLQLNASTETLIKLRDTLLPKLISGDLRIPNNEKLRSA